MDSVIEVQRQTHEEIERFERALYTLLSRNASTHESKLQGEHRAAGVLDRISSRVTTLNNLYEDTDARNPEINALSAPPNNQNDLDEFYSRLSKIREHHNKYPDSVAGGFELELASLLEEPNQDGDEFEDEDRTCFLHDALSRLSSFQPYPCSFPERKLMANILTSMPTIPHTTISSILENARVISNISTYSWMPRMACFIQNCPKRLASLRITRRRFLLPF